MRKIVFRNFGNAPESRDNDKFLTPFVNPDRSMNDTTRETLRDFAPRALLSTQDDEATVFRPHLAASVLSAVTYASWRSWRIKPGNRRGFSSRSGWPDVGTSHFPSTLHRNGPPRFYIYLGPLARLALVASYAAFLFPSDSFSFVYVFRSLVSHRLSTKLGREKAFSENSG